MCISLNLVLDLFCGRMGKEELDNLEYNYGQIAGYPAGKDAPVLENIEQFQAYKGRGYITFETDSIIPMNAYRLKSASDRTNNTYRRVGNRVSSGRQWHTYSTTRPLTKAYIYNRYYLVKLPDGNYVAAYPEDAYYWKYKLAGKGAAASGSDRKYAASGKGNAGLLYRGIRGGWGEAAEHALRGAV